MATEENKLNLLVIDENQVYAERLVTLLSEYYDEVSLGFLDDRDELIKNLRHQWDVLVFGHAYDMSFTDVVGILQEQEVDLPLICLMSDEMAATGRNNEGLPAIIDGHMVKALPAERETQIVLAICLEHANIKTRRQYQSLRHILSEAEQRANILIKNSKSAVAYIDQGIHIFANDPYIEMFGFDSMEDLLGVPVIDLIAGGDNVKGFKQFLRRFDKGARDQVEFKFESRRKDGSTFKAKLQLAAATFEGAPVTQVIIQQSGADAAEIAKALAEAKRKDSLTGLDNRQGFEATLAATYAKIEQNNSVAALMYVRLDNIGKVNSSLGLQGTDEVVKQIGYTLDEFFEHGYVSRFSDTTFAVIVEDKKESEVKQLADDVRLKIADMLIEVGKRTASTTVSIGMVLIDKNAPESSIVVERAIDASSQVLVETQNMGNGIHLYDPSQHANEDDSALAEYLVDAISQNRFELTYQPIYDIETDRSDFFEVYVHLPLADGTKMPPDKFMSVAKQYQLLEKIDRWVLINACKQLSLVRKQNPDSRILVQLSSASLADTKLAGVVAQLIKAVGGAPNALTLQFREQDVVDYMAVAKKQFAMLSKAGGALSIYNFGMTAKAVETAEFVSPNMVRLAQSYVTDLSNEENLAAVKTLVARANEQNFGVLMPYIEEAATMSVAWSVGARYLQGDYLQEPATTMHVV